MALQLNLENNLKTDPLSMSFSRVKDEQETEERKRTRRIKEMVRDLKRKEKAEEAKKNEDYYSKMTGSSSDKKDEYEIKEPVNYNFKEISTKIQRAKTSVRAAQALISARRKVLEIKSKISSGKGDPEELQLALTHAKRMELVARKKKHHLELEEMAEYSHKDEGEDPKEESAVNLKNAMVSAEEEKVSEKEDAVFYERQSMLEEETAELKDSSSAHAEQAMTKLNEMIAEFGEDELKELEESMEMLENMEIIDPHMSKEDLKELKTKHRNDENKAIVKADMDYLKEMIKHMVEKGGAAPVSTGFSGISMASPVITAPEGVCVDIQL